MEATERSEGAGERAIASEQRSMKRRCMMAKAISEFAKFNFIWVEG